MQPILTIDLASTTVGSLEIPREWEQDYLGGASLAARVLFDYLVPDLEPLSA